MKSKILIACQPIEHCFSKSLISVLLIFVIISGSKAQSIIPELSFRNPVLRTGKGCAGEGQDGAIYIFSNVGWGMDALVTILGRSHSEVVLTSADIQGPEDDQKRGTGIDNAWQPGISFGQGHAQPHLTWWMEFKISFVSHQDGVSLMPVNQFFVSGLDIDGDDKQLHEFQVYFKSQSYTLENQSAIFTSSFQGSELDPFLKGERFDGTVKDCSGVSGTNENAMVVNFYRDCASLVVRLGAETGNLPSDQANRKYGLLFKSVAYGVPVVPQPPPNLFAVGEQTNGQQNQ